MVQERLEGETLLQISYDASPPDTNKLPSSSPKPVQPGLSVTHKQGTLTITRSQRNAGIAVMINTVF